MAGSIRRRSAEQDDGSASDDDSDNQYEIVNEEAEEKSQRGGRQAKKAVKKPQVAAAASPAKRGRPTSNNPTSPKTPITIKMTISTLPSKRGTPQITKSTVTDSPGRSPGRPRKQQAPVAAVNSPAQPKRKRVEPASPQRAKKTRK